MSRSRIDAIVVRLAPALLLGMFAAAPAEASLYRLDFSGRITIMTATGPGVPDEHFTGTLIYDDSIPLGSPVPSPWTPGSTEQSYKSGTFRAGDPTPDGTGLDVRIAGVSIAPHTEGLNGGWQYGLYGDGQPYSTLSFGTSLTPAPNIKGISILFEAADPALFADGKLPASLKLSDLSKALIGVSNVMNGVVYEDGDFVYTGEIDSLTVTAVPEPTWAVAALMGAAVWTARRRLRKA